MMKRRVTEAERLRQHNDEMKLALAENVTVLKARQLLAVRRARAFEEELERRRRCGTGDATSRPFQPSASAHLPAGPRQGGEPRFWWERD